MLPYNSSSKVNVAVSQDRTVLKYLFQNLVETQGSHVYQPHDPHLMSRATLCDEYRGLKTK